MSAQPIDNDVALPHAGLLAYFRPSTSSTQPPAHESAPPPPPYTCDTSDVTYSPITTLYKIDDEESQYGFWGERNSEDECEGMRLRLVKRDHQGFYSFCCFWCAALVCMIGAVGIIFTTDLALSSLGFGTGVSKLMVDASANVGSQSYNIHFCLASANRDVPGPQIWRHIGPDDVARCKTDVLTLSSASTEHWKLRIDDLSLFGEDIPRQAASDKGVKFMDVDKKAHSESFKGQPTTDGAAGIWDPY